MLAKLSQALSASLGKGFSYANLRNFRQFYLTYPDPEICYTVCSKLSWSHNRLIMREQDAKARAYYLAESAAQQWTVRQLERNLQSHSFQRLLSSQSAANQADPLRPEALGDFIKDSYVLEFLQLPELGQLRESDLEQAIIDELQKFLLELGKGFSFVARQMRISTVIGLPANLFYSTGIPVCILVLKKCKKPDDVLFINAAEHFDKGKRQNQLKPEHIAKIIKTYQFREEEARYSRKVEMAEIEKNDFNLNISRYISTAVGEAEIVLDDTHQALVEIEKAITTAKDKHNAFLKELGLKPLP